MSCVYNFFYLLKHELRGTATVFCLTNIFGWPTFDVRVTVIISIIIIINTACSSQHIVIDVTILVACCVSETGSQIVVVCRKPKPFLLVYCMWLVIIFDLFLPQIFFCIVVNVFLGIVPPSFTLRMAFLHVLVVFLW